MRSSADPAVHVSEGEKGKGKKKTGDLTYLSLMWKFTSKRYSSFVFKFDSRFCAIAMY